ncbi:hypothetical protein ACHAXH_003126 [Discostella pseudostelligera]
MATSATAAYEPHHLDQILSLLHDQRQCLTLRTIMLELTVTRCVARSLMNEVVRQCCGNNGNDENCGDEMVDEKRRNKYHVVRMRVSMDENNRRRMELVADSSDGDGKAKEVEGGGGGSSIFSISLTMPEDEEDNAVNNEDDDDGVIDDEEDVDENGNPIHGKKSIRTPASSSNHPLLLEQLVAAHEMALATQRDRAVSENGNGVGELLDIFCDMSILPSPELCGEEENDQGRRMVRRVKRGRDRMHLSSAPTTTGSYGKSGNSKVGSSTSKVSAAMPAISSSSSSSVPSKKGKPTTAAAFFGSHTTTKKKESNSSSNSNKGNSNAKTERNSKTNTDDDVVVMESPTEKENKANKSKKGVKAGVASASSSSSAASETAPPPVAAAAAAHHL